MGALYGEGLLNSGAVTQADGESWAKPFYTNKDNFTKYFRGFEISMGMTFGGRGDYTVALIRGIAGTEVIARAGWDRYAEPTGPVTFWRDYGKHYWKVPPGETLHLMTQVNAILGTSPVCGAVVSGYYTKEKPEDKEDFSLQVSLDKP